MSNFGSVQAKSSPPRLSLVVLYSFFASLILLLPTLIEGFRSEWASELSMQGNDEPYYLGRAQQIAKGMTTDFYYHESRDIRRGLSDAVRDDPRALGEYLGGAIGLSLGLSAVKGGVALDFIIAFVTIPLFFYLFFELSGRTLVAALATAVTIALPWSLSLHGGVVIHVLQSGLLEKFGVVTDGYPLEVFFTSRSLPVFRGISCQLSYPIIASTLLMFLRFVKRGGVQSVGMFVVGLCAGLLFYIYIFAAGTAAGVITFFSLLNGKATGIATTCKNLIAFLFGFFIAVLPWVSFARDSQTVRQFRIPELSQFFWVSPALLLTLIIFVVILRRTDCLSKSLTLRFYCSTLVAELFLVNLQPISGVFLASYRFGELYLHPIGTGILVTIMAQFRFNKPLFKGTLRVFSLETLIISCLLHVTILYFMSRTHTTGEDEPTVAPLVKFLQTTDPKSVLAAVSNRAAFRKGAPTNFSSRSRPNYISALSERSILTQEWAPRWNSDDLAREIYLTWLYTGRLTLQWPCPSEVELPGDIFLLTWTATSLMRKNACQNVDQLLRMLSACELFKRYKVDYILWESRIRVPKPPHPFTAEVWSSPDRTEIVYQIDQSRLRATACPTTSP